MLSAYWLSCATVTLRLFATSVHTVFHIPLMNADTCSLLASLILSPVNISVALLYAPTFTTCILTPNFAIRSFTNIVCEQIPLHST